MLPLMPLTDRHDSSLVIYGTGASGRPAIGSNGFTLVFLRIQQEYLKSAPRTRAACHHMCMLSKLHTGPSSVQLELLSVVGSTY